MNILAIEDNPVTGTAIGCELRACGFHVTVSPSAEDALSLLKTGLQYDLIILDFHLPGEQGPEFYRRLGMDPQYRDIPVIPFTSQMEASSSTSDDLMRNFDMSKTAIDKVPGLSNRQTSQIVSKGSSDAVEELPASLYVAIAEVLRQKDLSYPSSFLDRLKTVLKTITVNKGG